MKKVILLILMIPVHASGQVTCDFESGLGLKWVQVPAGRWSADSSEALQGERSLHHIFDNNTSGNDCAGISLKDLHPDEGTLKWSFLLRHGYDPSSSNNWQVYLMCDIDPASVSTGSKASGFAIGINMTGYDDTLRLLKIKDGTISTVVRTGLNWQNRVGTKNPARVEIERNTSGMWNITVTDHTETIIAESSGTDKDLFACEWFTVSYRYTSTRDRLLWMDDLQIDGVFYEDKDPPDVSSLECTGRSRLKIILSEEPEVLDFTPLNFFVNGNSISASAIKKISSLEYVTDFPSDFNNKRENELIIKKLCDKNGNCIEDIRIPFTPVWAETGDVVITEIMADPSPPVSLPAKEYLEIYNRSSFPLSLSKWNLSFNGDKVHIPEMKVFPGDHIIICSESDTAIFRKYGKTAGLRTFPALSDDGKILALTDSLGNLIHGVEYSSGWYGDALKNGGGWSLEMIDLDYPFYAEGNWEASSSGSGGTPGKINSASRKNEDPSFSGILNLFPDDSINILLTFSETVTGISNMIEKIYLNGHPVKDIRSSDPLLRKFFLIPEEPLENKKVYSLILPSELTDFAGNPIINNTFSIGIPGISGKGDVVFNELLFDPVPGETDYIELYNCSMQVLDVSGLFLASVSETGDTSGLVPVSSEKRCLLPGIFYTITSSGAKVLARYFSNEPQNIFTVTRMPSMPDDRGHLLLLNHRAEIIDEVIYTGEMHHPLLSGSEGIALEKFRPESESSNPSSWHSASESSGWGTPGTSNSVYVPDPEAKDIITFSSKRISPDNDGFEDLLIIDFNLEGTGNVVSVSIFDETGTFVRKIAVNYFAGADAALVWDGTGADGTLVRQGIYVIFIQLYNENGKTRSWKKVCTVIR